MMDGKLCRIKCPGCGFTDYVTDQQWNRSDGGVWAFKWWTGTNKNLPCPCPKCGKVDMNRVRLISDHFGILVVLDESLVIAGI